MLIKRRPEEVLGLFIQLRDDGQMSSEHHLIVQSAKHFGISIQNAHRERLTELCGSQQHQGVVALARTAPMADETILDNLLMQDDVLFWYSIRLQMLII